MPVRDRRFAAPEIQRFQCMQKRPLTAFEPALAMKNQCCGVQGGRMFNANAVTRKRWTQPLSKRRYFLIRSDIQFFHNSKSTLHRESWDAFAEELPESKCAGA